MTSLAFGMGTGSCQRNPMYLGAQLFSLPPRSWRRGHHVYGTLGPVVVDHVHFDEPILMVYYDGNTFNRNVGTLSTDTSHSYHTLDVTSAVRQDHDASRARSQFRLRLDTPPFVILDVQSDYAAFVDAEGSSGDTVHVPELVVEYTNS